MIVTLVQYHRYSFRFHLATCLHAFIYSQFFCSSSDLKASHVLEESVICMCCNWEQRFCVTMVALSIRVLVKALNHSISNTLRSLSLYLSCTDFISTEGCDKCYFACQGKSLLFLKTFIPKMSFPWCIYMVSNDIFSNSLTRSFNLYEKTP